MGSTRSALWIHCPPPSGDPPVAQGSEGDEKNAQRSGPRDPRVPADADTTYCASVWVEFDNSHGLTWGGELEILTGSQGGIMST